MVYLLWTVVGAFLSAGLKLLGPDRRWEELKVKHEWSDVPKGWVEVGRPPADHLLKINLGLRQDRFDELLGHLYEVSDPEHHRCVLIHDSFDQCSDISGTPRYGNHLSKEEVDELIAPSSTTVESLEAWLAYHDIDPISSLSRTDAGDWMTITVPIGKVEKMLDAKYRVYEHVDTGETIVRTMSYSLPRVLHDHVSVVVPTTYFGTTRAMKSHVHIREPVDDVLNEHLFVVTPTMPAMKSDVHIQEPVDDQVSLLLAKSTQTDVPDICVSEITPACLLALYNATEYKPTAANENVLGVAGYLDQFANYADLQVSV